jgi:hypothetical protein
MLPSLTIEGFRAFRRLEVPRLGRVNLIVGSNNVGKTSLLEALQLLTAGARFPALLDIILENRGEISMERQGSGREIDLLRVFHRSSSGESHRQLRVAAASRELAVSRAWALLDDDGEHLLGTRAGRYRVVSDPSAPSWNAVEVLYVGMEGVPPFPLLLDGSLDLPTGLMDRADRAALKSCHVPAAGLRESESARLWDSVVLQGEEDFLIEVLRVIAPDIGRVFFIEAGEHRVAFIRRAGQRTAEPLHSLGGGMRRLLDLALGLVDARGGLLLVDEIENGIHYSVQPDLWSLVFEAATRLDVQVFATTHSWDCIEAFQQAAAAHPATGELIRLHRSDAGIAATVADEADLAIITRQAIEVR